MKFGGNPTMSDKAKTVEKRLGKTTKGTAEKARPSSKTSLKGTNPMKGKAAISKTWKY